MKRKSSNLLQFTSLSYIVKVKLFKLTTMARNTFLKVHGWRAQIILATGSSSKLNAFALTTLVNSSFTLAAESVVEVDCTGCLSSAALTRWWTKETSSWRAWIARGSSSCDMVLCSSSFPLRSFLSHAWSKSLSFWSGWVSYQVMDVSRKRFTTNFLSFLW